MTRCSSYTKMTPEVSDIATCSKADAHELYDTNLSDGRNVGVHFLPITSTWLVLTHSHAGTDVGLRVSERACAYILKFDTPSCSRVIKGVKAVNMALFLVLTATCFQMLQYLLTTSSRDLIQKLTGSQVVKKFPHIMQPEGSSPHSQVSVNCPYPEPARSGPYPYIPPPEDPS